MIYIIKHKEIEIPKIEGYKELGVGECFKGNKDNINELNPYLNEETGMYDIWKNCKDEIKGQIQYRKHLDDEGSFLSYDKAKELLNDYDIITTTPYVVGDGIYHNLRGEIGEESIKQVLDKYYCKLIEIEPDLEEYFNTNYFSPGNMFICKKEIYDKYCEWLFSIMIPLAEQFAKEDFNCGKTRMMAYIGERLLTYWLRKSNLKIKELNYVITGERV